MNTPLKSELKSLLDRMIKDHRTGIMFEADGCILREAILMCDQLSAANKRLEEAEKQEPVAVILHDQGCRAPDDCEDFARLEMIAEAMPDDLIRFANAGRLTHLYTRPIPPADVAELQRKLDTCQKWKHEQEMLGDKYARQVIEQQGHIAELERKLAEQQAHLARHTQANGCDVSIPFDNKELNKLLSEAREKAVPDALRYKWLRSQVNGEQLPMAQVVWKSRFIRDSSEWTNLVDGNSLDKHIDLMLAAFPNDATYADLLAAAPSASLNAKEGGEC